MNACRNSKSPALIFRATGEIYLRRTRFCLPESRPGSSSALSLANPSNLAALYANREERGRLYRNSVNRRSIRTLDSCQSRPLPQGIHAMRQRRCSTAEPWGLGVNYRTSSSDFHRRDWRPGNMAHGNPAHPLQPGRASMSRPRMPKPLIPPVRHPNKENPANSREDNSAGTFGLYSREFPASVRLVAFSKSKRIR